MQLKFQISEANVQEHVHSYLDTKLYKYSKITTSKNEDKIKKSKVSKPFLQIHENQIFLQIPTQIIRPDLTQIILTTNNKEKNDRG